MLFRSGHLQLRAPGGIRGINHEQQQLGPRAEVVLGNHDLHLIARADGLAAAKDLDTVEDVLAAKDRNELVDWLASRKLIYRDGQRVLVHAGLLPSWTVADAEREARRLETTLRDKKARAKVLGKQGFDPSLKALTTLRTVKDDDEPCKFSGPPAEAPPGCRRSEEHTSELQSH